jgi:hypothetical protein
MAAPGAQRSSSAAEVMKVSGTGELGDSSKSLGVEDFELVKTLGTGRLGVLLSLILPAIPKEQLKCGPVMNTVTLLTSFHGVGTFARVWLARLRGHDGGNDKLYALKVLRKAEGGLRRYL